MSLNCHCRVYTLAKNFLRNQNFKTILKQSCLTAGANRGSGCSFKKIMYLGANARIDTIEIIANDAITRNIIEGHVGAGVLCTIP